VGPKITLGNSFPPGHREFSLQAWCVGLFWHKKREAQGEDQALASVAPIGTRPHRGGCAQSTTRHALEGLFFPLTPMGGSIAFFTRRRRSESPVGKATGRGAEGPLSPHQPGDLLAAFPEGKSARRMGRRFAGIRRALWTMIEPGRLNSPPQKHIPRSGN